MGQLVSPPIEIHECDVAHPDACPLFHDSGLPCLKQIRDAVASGVNPETLCAPMWQVQTFRTTFPMKQSVLNISPISGTHGSEQRPRENIVDLLRTERVRTTSSADDLTTHNAGFRSDLEEIVERHAFEQIVPPLHLMEPALGRPRVSRLRSPTESETEIGRWLRRKLGEKPKVADLKRVLDDISREYQIPLTPSDLISKKSAISWLSAHSVQVLPI
jgi:hypothetical protein